MLGRFEEAVLVALMKRPDQTINDVHEALCDLLKKEVALGAIFTTLDRLTEKKFVDRRKGDPLPQRGGKARNYYTITGGGRQAVMDAQSAIPMVPVNAAWAG